jgi:tetratricopeptide (TPR) repeat protein
VTIDRTSIALDLGDRIRGGWRLGGGACLISGDAGLGKTRLAELVVAKAPQNVARMVGRGLPTGTAPLLPICKAIAESGVDRSDGRITAIVEEYAGAVHVFRELLAPMLRVRRARRFGPALGSGFAPSESYTFVALVELLRRIADKSNLLLLIDDIQWLDASSLAFVGHLLQEVGRFPFFVLLTGRSNGTESASVRTIRETLGRLPRGVGTSVKLPPLTVAETAEVAHRMLGAPLAGSAEDAAWLQRTSKGNPKYLAEVLTHLQQAGSLVRIDEGWTLVVRQRGLVVPPPVSELVRERIENATVGSPRTETLIEFAAICGRRFDVRLAARASKMRVQSAVAAFRRLARVTGYVRRDGSSHFFEFDHDLTRESVLGGLGALAPEMHGTVGDILADDPDAAAFEVAAHFRNAGRLEAAATQYEIAARAAQAQAAFNDAVEFSTEEDALLAAAGLGESAPSRVRAASTLGINLVAAERYDEAIASLRSRAVIAEASGDLDMLWALGRALMRQSDHASHVEAVAILAAAARVGSKDQAALARVAIALSCAYDAVGEFAASQAAFRTAFKAAVASKDVRAEIHVRRLTCMVWQPEKVVEAVTDAVRMARQHGLNYEAAMCLNNLGAAHFHLNQLADAQRCFEGARDELRLCGGYRQDIPENNLALLAMVKGRLDEARHLLDGASRRSCDKLNRIFIRTNQGALEGLAGSLDRASEILREAVGAADAAGDVFYRHCARLNLARVQLLRGAPADAVATLTGCPPHHSANDDLLVLGKRAVLLREAYAALGGGKPDEAHQRAETVLSKTTKPQAWLYRLPWHACDIEYWED